jgi:hypothetical protein
MAVNTKMAVFRVIALMMERTRISEMLVNFYQTTWHYNPENSHLNSDMCALICHLDRMYW